MDMFRKSSPATLAILAIVVLVSGCQLSQKFGGEAIDRTLKAMSSNSLVGTASVKADEEAKICIETAKTVAEAGHFDEAIQLYEKAGAIDPNNGEISKKLAPLYAQTGNYEQSISTYRSALDFGGDVSPSFFNNFAWTLMEANRLDEARELANQGVAQFPNSAQLITTLAVVNYRTGSRQAAFDLFAKALGEAAAHHNIAVLDIEAGDRESAQSHLASAMKLNPTQETLELSEALGPHAQATH